MDWYDKKVHSKWWLWLNKKSPLLVRNLINLIFLTDIFYIFKKDIIKIRDIYYNDKSVCNLNIYRVEQSESYSK